VARSDKATTQRIHEEETQQGDWRVHPARPWQSQIKKNKKIFDKI
jgi:hypothetical protein